MPTYEELDALYLPLDKEHVRRTQNLRLIPTQDNRRGGKFSYAEWAHVIGIFQTLMFLHLDKKTGNQILDVGCGTGLLGIASEAFISDGGKYIGLDVMQADIQFCQQHYPSPVFEFIHFDVHNSMYASNQHKELKPWPLDGQQFDLVTALSVWTHLNETDARFYLKEVKRVLKPKGKAIISFFILDKMYQASLKNRTEELGRFHRTAQTQWIFDSSAHGSEHWRCPSWAELPESAIGITSEGLESLCNESGLTVLKKYLGNWKEQPGLFFQDVLVLGSTEESVSV